MVELKNSSNKAAMIDGGKSTFRQRPKFLRNLTLRESLMSELELGNTALMSYQQAMGGSLSMFDRATEVEDAEFEDVEPINCPRRSVNIRVPELNEIKVPLALRPPSSPSIIRENIL